MKDRILELVEKLNKYTELYDKGIPAISDKEWDDMYFELSRLEAYANFYPENSPTQRVVYSVMNDLKKVKHNHPMLSLDKTKDVEEIRKFIGDKTFIAMLKLDGLTCSLRYLNGQLVGAETRGNGIIGEDVLHNAMVIKNIPKRISFTDGELIVDGEIICTNKDFEPFADEYKNARNFASGSIRLLDSKECARRNLSFVAWDVFGDEYRDDFLSEKLYELESYGFTITPYSTRNLKYYDNKDGTELENIINNLQEFKKIFPIDGLVFKYDTTDEYEAAGRTDHHFKGGLALKFYDEEYETTLEDIEWTMGRTGQLTPVAILTPIEIDGTEVSRASLHNISIMKELDISHYGCKVMVYKANMIIPQISQVIGNDTNEIIVYPCKCPICGGNTSIHKEVDSEVLYCDNPQCEGKLLNKIEHFFGKKGLDAKGISKATISKLIDLGWITRIRDVFDLWKHKDEWKALPGFGEKSVSNILGAIEACKNCSLEAIISAAGIPLIGRTVAKDIAGRFATYGAFKERVLGDFDFSSLDGYGYEMNKSLKSFDYSELDYIVEEYLTIEEENINYFQEVPGSISLEGLQYCITGKLNIWKNREELTKTIESLGGKVTGSVSKNTTHLINNDINSTSAKNKKAQELGVAIITEQMFADIIDFQK